MTASWVIAAGVFGAMIGSFLNVVAHRVPLGESIVSPGSRCPTCRNDLAAYDNVPVVSWLVLRGRCRHCGAKISARYPLIELLTAGTFAAIVAVRGADADLVVELPFAAILIALAAIDLEHRILPNRILLPAAVFGVAAAAVVHLDELPELLIAGTAGFTALLLVALAKPGGMMMGDVKLAGVMGLYLGLALVPALLVAFLAGSVVGIGMMAIRGMAARKEAVPFGPFLALGALVGLLAGDELVDLYSSSFL
jgi:leader peptidase (prepilin peptidase) / N-methyltransferase